MQPGENKIEIEVSTTLTNRMKQRGYDKIRSGWTEDTPEVQSYGLQGCMRIEPYKLIEL